MERKKHTLEAEAKIHKRKEKKKREQKKTIRETRKMYIHNSVDDGNYWYSIK